MDNVYEFGKKLLTTRDLDPVYVLLHQLRLEGMMNWELERWLMAYWCFYHVGTASWITEGDRGYWARMNQAAASKEYPRCHERRHYRGTAAINSVRWLESQGLEWLFSELWRKSHISTPVNCARIIEWVKGWVGFGPWIAFKVADMLERLDMNRVDFTEGDVFMFDSPRAGAELMWKQLHWELEPPADIGHWAATEIRLHLGHFKAPPNYNRLINVQEAETILCKWKSYYGGHYQLLEDIHGCRLGLMRFPRCRLSQRLLAAGKAAKLW